MKVNIKLIPVASEDKIEILDDKTFKVWVKAPPINGAANIALIALMAKHFGVAKSRVRVARGFKSKSKVLEII